MGKEDARTPHWVLGVGAPSLGLGLAAPKMRGFLFFSFFLGRTKQLKEEEEEEEGEAPLATTARKEPIQFTPEEEWKTNTRTSSGATRGQFFKSSYLHI